MNSLYDEIFIVNARTAANITTNTTTNGLDINRNLAAIAGKDYQEIVFNIIGGTHTDGDFSITVQHADDNAGSPGSYAAAEAALVRGGNQASGALLLDTNGQGTNGNFYMSYVGLKPWARISIVSTGVTTGWAAVAATAVYGRPSTSPVR